MRIVFDYQIFSLQQYGGISRYFLELAQNLPYFCKDIETAVVAPYHISPLLTKYSRSGQISVIGRQLPIFPGKHLVLPSLNRLASSSAMNALKPDLIHETYYSDHTVEYDCPRILTVYDMIHERFHECFTGVDRQIPELKKKAVHRVDHVITISQSTRDDLIEFLDIPPERISIVPLASSLKRNAENHREKCDRRPYLLYIGLRGGVKNFNVLFRAYMQSEELRSNFDLLCVGGGQFSKEEISLIARAGLTAKVVQLEADDSTLASLYSSAAVFVYPSLHEGFGMPILEAMQCGCPVACSNTSSMPEIAGEAAMFFDPKDPDEIGSVLESVVHSSELTEKMRRLGYEQVKKYSWEQCSHKTAQIYRQYAKKYAV